MPLLIEIPAQKATAYEKRIAALVECNKSGKMTFRSYDNKLPTEFYLNKEDIFPWKMFFRKLRFAWFRAKEENIPKAFLLQKRIDESLLDAIEMQNEKDIPKIFAALRRMGYFRPLRDE